MITIFLIIYICNLNICAHYIIMPYLTLLDVSCLLTSSILIPLLITGILPNVRINLILTIILLIGIYFGEI